MADNTSVPGEPDKIAAWETDVPRDLLKLHGRWRSDAIDAYLQAPIALRLKITKGEKLEALVKGFLDV